MTDPQLGVLMLVLFIFFIMLGFPIAFTLMALGVGFATLAYDGQMQTVAQLVVQRTWSVMTNDVLISVPLFVFMGYVIERANILDRLFRSIQIAAGGLPGSLAVATLLTCALFATATGIVGAVVTLMGLLAFPAMLRQGYDVRALRRRGLRGRLPGHSDSPQHHAHSLRRHDRRVAGATLCRRFLPGAHARGIVHGVCDHQSDDQSIAGAEGSRRKSGMCRWAWCSGTWRPRSCRCRC